MTNSYFQTANQIKQKGQFSEALAYYYQAIEQNPKFHWYHHNLGETLAKLERFEDAIASFQQAINISPNGSSYYGMAQSYTQLGNIDRANLAYYRAIELNLNWGLLLVRQAGLDRVIACFDYVLKRAPDQAMVYYDFSRYLADKNLMDDAIRCFQKAPQFSHRQEVNNKGDQEKLPDSGSIYEILWKNLNRLGKIDDLSEPISTKSEAEGYLEKNRNYTIQDCSNVGCVFPEIPSDKITKLASNDDIMLIPIGAWCRTAYQVREFNTKNNTTSESFPFDWTISSFAALQRILSPEFNPAQILDLKNLYINKFGSLSDSYSDLIFHHDLSPALVSKYHSDDRKNFIDISPQLIDSGVIDQAKERFIHTFSKLKDYCKSGNQKIGFIRWFRSGHPDPELPNVFTDENIFSLYQLLQSFCGHNKFYVLRIMTKYVDALPSEGSVLECHKYSNVGASILLAERPGYNGDRSNNFAGDCQSWTEALTGFTFDCEIDYIPRY